MDYAKKIAGEGPLKELWNAEGPVQAVREQDFIDTEDIKALLRNGPITFVVADPCEPLQWVPLDKCFEFWKTVKPNITNDCCFFLEDFPGEFVYVATKWRRGSGEIIILLEQHH